MTNGKPLLASSSWYDGAEAVTNDAEILEAERCFELLVTGHLADASVTRGTGFGSTTGLR